MADEEIELSADENRGAENSKVGKPMAKIVIVAVGGIFILGGSVAATLYLTAANGPSASQELAAAQKEKGESAGEKKTQSTGEPIYLPLDPPITVSLESDESRKYMQVSMSVMSRKEAVVDAVRKHRPAIRNNLNLLFSDIKHKDLVTREGKEKLREAARQEIENTLKANGEDSEVEAIYFTSLVID